MTEDPNTESKRARKLYLDILRGAALPGAVFGTFAAIWLLWPIESEQSQTGYRGTGMVQFTPEEDAAVLAGLNDVEVYSEEPYIPAEGDDLAGEFYENVQVLDGVTVDNFNRLMAAITQWVSPEQGCAYCHGEEGNFASDEYYPKLVARRMIQMTQNINENWSTHVAAYPEEGQDQVGVTCYTCHRGETVPQYHWYTEPRPEAAAQLGDNTMLQNRSDATAGYSSLPGDPLTAYLLEAHPIRVQSEVPREGPFNASLQDTEWTYSLMFHFSSSLGVNCTFCHNSRAWGSWEQSPPVRMKAWYAVRMLRDANQNYMHNLDVYPASRLGPTGDAPKANCTTCHQGVNKPLYGANMVKDWPELMTTGDPVYDTDDGSSAALPEATGDRAEAETTAAN